MQRYIQMGDLFDYGKNKIGIFCDSQIPHDHDNIVVMLIREDGKEYLDSFRSYNRARGYVSKLLSIAEKCFE